MPSKIGIVQAAIARCGSEVPAALAMTTDELAVTNVTYDTIVEDFLCRHGSKFCTRWTTINPNATTPAVQWQAIYPLPGDLLNLREAYVSADPYFDWDIVEQTLHANTNLPIDIYYNFRPSEERWPGDFAKVVETELLAELFDSFDERTKAADAHQWADKKLKEFIRRNKTQAPGRRRSNPRLLRAWYGRTPGRR